MKTRYSAKQKVQAVILEMDAADITDIDAAIQLVWFWTSIARRAQENWHPATDGNAPPVWQLALDKLDQLKRRYGKHFVQTIIDSFP